MLVRLTLLLLISMANLVASESQSLANSRESLSCSTSSEAQKALKVSNAELERMLDKVDEEDEAEFNQRYNAALLEDQVAQWMGMLERNNPGSHIFAHVFTLISNQVICDLYANPNHAREIIEQLNRMSSKVTHYRKKYVESRLKLLQKIQENCTKEPQTIASLNLSSIESDQKKIEKDLACALSRKNFNKFRFEPKPKTSSLKRQG